MLFLVYHMIFPCLISVIVAYSFNPLVVKFEKHKIPRLYSVIFIIFVLLLALVLVIMFVLPIIYVQITSVLNFLISQAPSLNLKAIPSVLEFLNIKVGDGLFDLLSENLAKNCGNYMSYSINAFGIVVNFIVQALSSSFGLIHALSLVVVIPTMFFYMLRDWPLIIVKISELVPVLYKEKVTDFFLKVDFIIFNYLKGQANICVIMVAFYSIGLSVIGLKHPIAIGILAGTLTFIPYIGPLIYTTVGFFSAIAQFSWWFKSAAVLLLFSVGQLIDANILVPLLIGKKVHMHPGVVILGITTCASYFGLIGILFFIPIIAIFNVSIKYVVDVYLQSEFYKGS
nr:AI-2E family transporter [Wolbachia endosymbiont of Dirofilaria (Dirofilaria) immitis]